jgi:hypothetical protein
MKRIIYLLSNLPSIAAGRQRLHDARTLIASMYSFRITNGRLSDVIQINFDEYIICAVKKASTECSRFSDRNFSKLARLASLFVRHLSNDRP